MPRILVRPEDLRALSAQYQNNADELQSIVSRLASTLGSLDWQARQAAGVESEWGQARSMVYNLTWQANSLARYLATKAQSFEDADHAGASGIGQVLGAFTTVQQQSKTWWQQFQLGQLLPQLHPVQLLLDLGTRIGNSVLIPTVSIVGLSSLLGSMLVGVRFLKGQPAEWQNRLDQAAPTPVIQKGGLERAVRSGFASINQKEDSTPSDTTKASVSSPSPGILDQPFQLRDGRTIVARNLDGQTPLVGLDSTRGKPGQLPLQAPITSGPDGRRPDLTNAVINQFGVENNPRYTRDAYTYCNTFAGDYSRAMGVPLPTKADLGIKGDQATIGAEPLYKWFTERSSGRGWREVTPATSDGLQTLVNHVKAGKPVLAADSGHVAIIRPNQAAVHAVADLHIAQAGAHNLNDVRLGDAGLGTRFNPRYFVHD